MPLIRAPFHFSYLLFLAQKSEKLAEMYFRIALRLCRLAGVGPSLLLHPLDFLGGDDIRELEFFPAMGMPGEKKREFIDRMLGLLVDRFDVLPMNQRARKLIDQGDRLSQRAMKF
jgi:hypothetical protein